LTLSPCQATATLSVGRTVIARTGPEPIGAGELGYLVVPLTSHGRALLTHAPGNQLGAHVSITDAPGTTATTATLTAITTANIALVSYR
jgi:hypothetical protein